MGLRARRVMLICRVDRCSTYESVEGWTVLKSVSLSRRGSGGIHLVSIVYAPCNAARMIKEFFTPFLSK